MNADFQIQRNPFGQLVFTGADGVAHTGVEPARSFPITAPREGISILSGDGHELAWIPDLDQLDNESRGLIEAELEVREFMPEIARITGVSGYATPCTWHVETNKGDTSFTLKAEEDIRRLAPPTLMIMDKRGIQFLIRNPRALDATSRRILDRFM
jgi:hypothetical protein